MAAQDIELVEEAEGRYVWISDRRRSDAWHCLVLAPPGGHRGESIAFYNLDIKVVCLPISRQFRRAPRDQCELTTLLKLDLVINCGFFSAGAPLFWTSAIQGGGQFESESQPAA